MSTGRSRIYALNVERAPERRGVPPKTIREGPESLPRLRLAKPPRVPDPGHKGPHRMRAALAAGKPQVWANQIAANDNIRKSILAQESSRNPDSPKHRTESQKITVGI